MSGEKPFLTPCLRTRSRHPTENRSFTRAMSVFAEAAGPKKRPSDTRFLTHEKCAGKRRFAAFETELA